MLEQVWGDKQHRMDACRVTDGAHIESLNFHTSVRSNGHSKIYISESICSNYKKLFFFFVHQLERLLASVACGSGPSVINLKCQLPSGEPLVTGRRGWIQRSLSGKAGYPQTKDYSLAQTDLILKTESAKKRNWIRTLTVEYESGASDVVCSVVTENERLIIVEGNDGFLLEYDFYLII